MGLKVGIVGMPNVGKSTLFNAITNQKILAANYPFATIEPNVGIVNVPDNRFDNLVKGFEPKSEIRATIEFVDIAGLVKGASSGEGLGNKFLSNIRESDAICEVVRCFDDKSITHVEGHIDPVRDIEIIDYELLMSDFEIVNNRLLRIQKKVGDKEVEIEKQILLKIKDHLEQGKPIRDMEFNDLELEILKPFNFISLKPVIYLANVKEEDLGDDNEYVKRLREYVETQEAELIVICAKIEEELSELDDEEKQMFLEDLGISESGLSILIKSAYNTLGLRTYFTVGKEEVRAWTFKEGMKAPECAGIIHTDFEKGFIKAEVYSYKDYENLGSEKAIKESGKLRLEGKEYIMKDGDICHFRFNN